MLKVRQKLKVKAGDRFGFVWLRYGVVSFDYVKRKGHYCENRMIARAGRNVRLVRNRYSNRDYAIRVIYKPACGEICHLLIK